MLEIGKSGSVRGVDVLCMAEYCDTPQSKEGRNGEYKVCLSNRAIVHLLDYFYLNDKVFGVSHINSSTGRQLFAEVRDLFPTMVPEL